MQMKNIQIGNGGLLVQFVCEFLFIIIQKDLLRFEQKCIVKIKSRSFLNFIYLIITVTIYLVSFLRFLLATTVTPIPEPSNTSTHNSRLFIRQMLLTNPQITPIAVNVGTQTYFIDPNTIIYLQSG